jgi:hypothetical protein
MEEGSERRESGKWEREKTGEDGRGKERKIML